MKRVRIGFWVALCCICVWVPLQASSDILVPTRTIRAKEVIGPDDIMRKQIVVAGALSQLDKIVGQEARIALYPGRPIRPGDIGPPAAVDRNDVVALVFVSGGLRIATEGRVLGRGAVGEAIRVMNLSSRTTVTGFVQPDGTVEVHQ